VRTNEFKFKKTKRVRTVTEHRGLCVDLTEQEVADIHELLMHVGGISAARTETFKPLLEALSKFRSGSAAKIRIKTDASIYFYDL
jgi:hypothetical protein